MQGSAEIRAGVPQPVGLRDPRFVMSYVRKFIPIGLFDIASLPLACDQHGAAAQQQDGHGSNGRDYV